MNNYSEIIAAVAGVALSLTVFALFRSVLVTVYGHFRKNLLQARGWNKAAHQGESRLPGDSALKLMVWSLK